MPRLVQSLIDAIQGNSDPKTLSKKIYALAKDRKEAAALDDAVRVCSGRVEDGTLAQDDFWNCVSLQFQENLKKPSNLTIEYTPEIAQQQM